MTSSTGMSDKIIEGAMRAVARYGVRKFSMSDICEEAGISRGSLYRYFKSKEQVLEAVGDHVERAIRDTLVTAVDTNPEPAARLEVVLQAMLDYRTEHPATMQLIEAEPAFALELLTRQVGMLLSLVTDLLDPVLRDAPPIRDGSMTKRQLAEVFIRLVLSVYLIPTTGSEETAKRVAVMWQSMTAASAPAAKPGRKRAAG
ncbi:TetR family transcriptional regulator [Actinocorallia herbida]|uniref:TetR family transcriptional regulator n=1 Tax=Actinocorallia herbida TaxID=58109 RepID=A0A3N1D3B0_9ACTN|nr:TetR/AcrR family transcriptional regulator [Actinocorallia herbida]ROO88027.1 TetR family transcriptional regulator [Actinocorallia herbida]